MSRPPEARPLRLAHRGDWRAAPENTLPALLAALRAPACDGLEFDVRTAADGTPVLLHDETLWRVQRRPERVDALLPGDLARYGIPTLAEVLAAVGETPFLDVELKGSPGPAVIDVLEALRGSALRNAAISSFEVPAIELVRAARPAWPVWLNADDLGARTLQTAVALGCTGLSVRWRAITEVSAGRVAAAGLELVAWTVRDRARFDRLAGLGVAAVCVEGAALDG